MIELSSEDIFGSNGSSLKIENWNNRLMKIKYISFYLHFKIARNLSSTNLTEENILEPAIEKILFVPEGKYFLYLTN